MKKTVSASFLKKTAAFLLALVMSVSLLVSASAAEKDSFEKMTSGYIIGDVYTPGMSTQILTALLTRAILADPTGFGANPTVYYIINSGDPAERGYFNIASNPSITPGGSNYVPIATAKTTIYEDVEWGLIGGSLVPYEEETDDPDQKIANAIKTAITVSNNSVLTEVVKTKGETGDIKAAIKAALGSPAWQTAWDAAGVTVAVTAYTAATETAAGSYTVTVTVNGKTAAVTAPIPSSGEKKITLAAQVGIMRSNETAEQVSFAVTSQNVTAGALVVKVETAAGTDVTEKFTIGGTTLAANGTATITIADKTTEAIPIGAYKVTVTRDDAVGTGTLTIVSAAKFTVTSFAFTDRATAGSVAPMTGSNIKVDGATFVAAGGGGTPKEFTVGVEYKITFYSNSGRVYTALWTPTAVPNPNPGVSVPVTVDLTGYYIKDFKFLGGTQETELTLTAGDKATIKVKASGAATASTFKPFVVNAPADDYTEFKVGESYDISFTKAETGPPVTSQGWATTAATMYVGKTADIAKDPSVEVKVMPTTGEQFSIAGFTFTKGTGESIDGTPANITLKKQGETSAKPFNASSSLFAVGETYEIAFTAVSAGVTQGYKVAEYTIKATDKANPAVTVAVTNAATSGAATFTLNGIAPSTALDGVTPNPEAPFKNIKIGPNAFIPRGRPGATEFTDGAGYTIAFTKDVSGLETDRSGPYTAKKEDAAGDGNAIFVPNTTGDGRFTVTDFAFETYTDGGTATTITFADTSNIKIGNASGTNFVDFVAKGTAGKTATVFTVDQTYTITFTANVSGVIKNYITTAAGYKAATGHATGTSVPVTCQEVVADPTKITRADLTFNTTVGFETIPSGSGIKKVAVAPSTPATAVPFVDSSVTETDTLKRTQFTVGTPYDIYFTVVRTTDNAVLLYKAAWTPEATEAGSVSLTGITAELVQTAGDKFTLKHSGDLNDSISFSNGDEPAAGALALPDSFKISGGWYGEATTINTATNGAESVIFETGQTYTISFELTPAATANTASRVTTTYKATYAPTDTTDKGKPLTLPAYIDTNVGLKYRVAGIDIKDGASNTSFADAVSSTNPGATEIKVKSSDDATAAYKDGLSITLTGVGTKTELIFQVGKHYDIIFYKVTESGAVREEYKATYTGVEADAGGLTTRDAIVVRGYTENKPLQFRVGSFRFLDNEDDGAVVAVTTPTYAAIGGELGKDTTDATFADARAVVVADDYFVNGVEYVVFVKDTIATVANSVYRGVTVWKANKDTDKGATVDIVAENITP